MPERRDANRQPLIALLGAITAIVFFLAGIPGIPRAGAQGESPEVTPTPTPDRLELLAEPTLPANPGQADLGSQDYWLHCMPCHGQRGEGLTEEFRDLYPPEDRNCWDSGCHGSRPYEGGFTLPGTVPPLVGPGALGKFETASSLFAFINAAMPFQAPGSLDAETYWRITAFVLRENGLAPGQGPLGPENALEVQLQPETTPQLPLKTSQPPGGGGRPPATPSPAAPVSGGVPAMAIAGVVALLLLAGAAGWVFQRQRG